MTRIFTTCISALLICAAVSRANLLGGATLLQDPVAGSLALAPLPAFNTPGTAVRFGLGSSFELRNDHLSFSVWNRYAGDSLSLADKRALLDDVGGQLATTAEIRLPVLEVAWCDSSGHRLAASMELAGQGVQRLDLSLLETCFMGNDPSQPLVVDQADMGAEALLATRLAWSAPLPWNWSGRLRQARWGLGLVMEKGLGWTDTHHFSGRVEPLEGELAGRFVHVQDRSASGSGQAFDLGLEEQRLLAGKPLKLQVALRSLFHSRTWRAVERTERSFTIPSTPIGSTFDFEAFSVDVQDTSITRKLGDQRQRLRGGWMLGADWQGTKWRHSLLAQQAPEDVRGKGRKGLALASTWRPFAGGLNLSAQVAGGFGRGPALGAAGGWQGKHFTCMLGATGFAGLGNASRGLRLGLDCRWTLY